MMKLTEKRDGQNVIPLRQDGKLAWTLCSAGIGDGPAQFLYGVHADKLAEYEEFAETFRSKMTDAACGFLKDKEEFAKWLDRNKWISKKCDEYARAENQGKLLKLPCAVGDKIYSPNKYAGKVIDFEIIEVCIFKEEIMFIDDSENEYFIDCFGRTVFLTREEAEAALKEIQGQAR